MKNIKKGFDPLLLTAIIVGVFIIGSIVYIYFSYNKNFKPFSTDSTKSVVENENKIQDKPISANTVSYVEENKKCSGDFKTTFYEYGFYDPENSSFSKNSNENEISYFARKNKATGEITTIYSFDELRAKIPEMKQVLRQLIPAIFVEPKDSQLVVLKFFVSGTEREAPLFYLFNTFCPEFLPVNNTLTSILFKSKVGDMSHICDVDVCFFSPDKSKIAFAIPNDNQLYLVDITHGVYAIPLILDNGVFSLNRFIPSKGYENIEPRLKWVNDLNINYVVFEKDTFPARVLEINNLPISTNILWTTKPEWKQYKSGKFLLSFSYPDNFLIREDENKIMLEGGYDKWSISIISVFSDKLPNAPIELKCVENDMGCPKYYSKEQDIKGYKGRVDSVGGEGGIGNAIGYVIYNGKLFTLKAESLMSGRQFEEQFIKLFQSFQFQ